MNTQAHGNHSASVALGARRASTPRSRALGRTFALRAGRSFLNNSVSRLIAGCGLVLAISAATAQQYQTTGVLQSVSPVQDRTYRFTMAVDGCEWCLRATVLAGRDNGVVQTNNFDYIEAGCDGESVYVVHSMQSLAKANPKSANVAVGSITRGSMPCDADMFIRDLWLGLASHCYFASASNGWFYPLFLDRQAAAAVEGRFAVKGFWTPLPGPPGLPRTVVYTFTFDGKLRSTAQNLARLSAQTNVILVVQAQQNFQGLLLPTRYRTERYSPAGQLTQEVEVQVETATNVLTLKLFPPSLPGPTFVADFRTTDASLSGTPVSYLATNWPGLEKVLPIERLQRDEQRLRVAVSAKPYKYKRLTVIIALAAASAAFLFLFRTRRAGGAPH
jgi:hypothetical protein